ncbi:hypothetical protein P7D22_03420 [Lichenihabitans sp. Uapishka_5]|uniref:hypothetical protein n=1 Tax=Lichenihabitans sp. Uapishka_5 TaxID=3037302 RepID=UPI0029E8288E|nr:hypothetical protein [Lichenihabitans sp. Uapishka_5]MDX7950228.1 hypothetical protein [Lichenihabitans sp. Uapishka_5]
MNDNFDGHLLGQRSNQSEDAWLIHLQEVRAVGVRALAKPESLTMGEIQDIAMGFLMASGHLKRKASSLT